MAFALVGSAGAAQAGADFGLSLTTVWGASETRAAGNLLVCWVVGQGANTLPAAPSGWFVASQQQGTSMSSSLFYTAAAGSDAAPVIAGVTSALLQGGVAEFSGGNTLDQIGSVAGTTSPIVATNAAPDVANGDLLLYCCGALYSVAATATLTSTLTNASATNLSQNPATSTIRHYQFGYGLTTAHSVADANSWAFTTTNITGAANAIASFKVGVFLTGVSAAAVSAAPSVTVSTGSTNCTVTAVSARATSTAPTPVVSVPTNRTITAVAASATSTVPTPAVNFHDQPLSEVYFGETYLGGEGLFPPPPVKIPGVQSGRVQVIRELPPTHLSLEIETPSGHYARWGRDEINGGNIPSGLRFSSTIPGGYESLDCALPRNPKFSYSDLEPLSAVKVFGAGGEQCWEGRIEATPVTSGDQMSVTVSATGLQSYLNDNESQNAVIIDRQLSRWSDTFTEHKEALHTAGYAPDGGSFGVEAGNPGRLALDIGDVDIGASPTIARPYPIAEAMYDAGAGVTLAKMLSDYGTLGSQGAGHDLEAPPWYLKITYGYRNSGSAEYITWDGSPTSVTLPGPGSVSINKPAGTGWRYILLQLFPTTSLTESGVDHKALFSDLRLIGNHGLTLYDDYDIDGNPIYSGSNPTKAGYLASDIVKWIIDTYFPSGPIRYDELTIQPSTFIIPNLVFSDTSPGAMLNETLRFGEPIPDWAIYNNGTMMLRERDPSRGQVWRARIGPAKLSETGPDISRLYNQVKVSYQDVDGSTRTVGPTGSCADVIDNSLKDTDPENPLNQRGAVKLKNLGVSTYVSQDKAVQIGQAFLKENKIISRAGQASLSGFVEHANLGVLFPYWSVKAGDYIEFIDASDPSPRHISRVDHDNDTRTATLAVDAPPDTLSGYMERLGVALIPLGL